MVGCSEEWKASCPSFSCVCGKIKGCCFRYAALFEIGMHSAISSQGPIFLVGLLQAQKLAQGNVIILNIHSPFPEDGEPWIQKPGCLEITHQEQERERDDFSQFITEGFTSYCKRKRRDKVYGNHVEIQGFCEMYNRPIHIYCYSTEPINIFHGSYNTDTPPIRLSYHHGNHYNSLVDPRRVTIGSGLEFSSLQGRNIDKDSVKAAIKAQKDQQIDNYLDSSVLDLPPQALLAEGRFYSDLEITEKESAW